MMSHNEAVFALGALAQDTRLMVFRHLVQAGAAGAAAGEIARALSVPHNTLSTHLAQLSRANLLDAQKEGRSVIYRVRQSGAKALLSYLPRRLLPGQSSQMLRSAGQYTDQLLLGEENETFSCQRRRH